MLTTTCESANLVGGLSARPKWAWESNARDEFGVDESEVSDNDENGEFGDEAAVFSGMVVEDNGVFGPLVTRRAIFFGGLRR